MTQPIAGGTFSSRTFHLRRRGEVENEIGEAQPPQSNGAIYASNNTTTDVDDASSGLEGGSSGGGVPLDADFFVMFFLVLLIVFSVLFLPVIWKCAKGLLARRARISDGDDNRSRSKEDVLDGIAQLKEKIVAERGKVRSMDTLANKDDVKNDGTESKLGDEENAVVAPPASATLYGTYFFNKSTRLTQINLIFSDHPHGGYVIHGSSEIQSGKTEITEGYLNPNGEAYFVEVGGAHPLTMNTSMNLKLSDDDLSSRRLTERDVAEVFVLYSGEFDFGQPNIIFTGWRCSSTGIQRTYHLLLRPRETTIRHFMSTVGSSIRSRRTSSTQYEIDGENESDEERQTSDRKSIQWSGQQGFPCLSKA